MLQILSTSNETSTGTELVQNGNFSQLGADLVENGLFDELGTDVITNGGFTGVTELVTNGDFATDTDWNKGSNWVISNNKATSDGSVDTYIWQTIVGLDLTKKYKIQVTCTNYDSGSLLPKIGSSGFEEYITSGGVFTYYGSFGSNDTLRFYSLSFIGSITNISVKEVGEDWTNGTGWSFGDSKAISTQALGSEEVTNGDFSAAGINLVDNPNFTDTGSELVVNGDFATDSDWVKAPSGVAISGGSANFNSSTDTYVYQDILTATKSYKIIFSGEIVTGSLYIGENGVSTNVS